MESLNINGKMLRLTIQRKPIRNLILRLKSPDELLVSAPYACSNAEVLRFIETKRSWIAAHAEKLARQQTRQAETAAAGKIMVYGKPVQLQWVIGRGKPRLLPDRLVLYGPGYAAGNEAARIRSVREEQPRSRGGTSASALGSGGHGLSSRFAFNSLPAHDQPVGQLYSGKIKDYAESEAGPLSAGLRRFSAVA